VSSTEKSRTALQTEPDAHREGSPRRRWRALVAGVLIVGFVVLVVSSTPTAVAPGGASGSMPGMSMSTGGSKDVRLTMRDIDGRPVRIPDGRPGVAVFVKAHGCGSCVEAVRAAARVVRRTAAPTTLLVINVDSPTRRGEMARFAGSAGPDTRYVIDDRNGSVASAFGASGAANAVVYDARGRIAARPNPTVGVMARALRRAGA